jgi:hypothetical protein
MIKSTVGMKYDHLDDRLVGFVDILYSKYLYKSVTTQISQDAW